MKKKITESRFRNIIHESVMKVLNEGMTSDNEAYAKGEWLEETIGAEEMLNNIFKYLDSMQLEQIIDWFEEDGYFEGYNEEF